MFLQIGDAVIRFLTTDTYMMTSWNDGYGIDLVYQDSIPDMGKFNCIMMSPNGKISRVIGHLWGEFTRWISLTKAGDVELWCFLWSAPEQTME